MAFFTSQTRPLRRETSQPRQPEVQVNRLHRSQHFFYLTRLRLSRNCCTFCTNSRACLIPLKIASAAEKSTFRFLDSISKRLSAIFSTSLRYYGTTHLYQPAFYFLYYLTTSSRTSVSKLYLIKRASHVLTNQEQRQSQLNLLERVFARITKT